MVGVGDMSGDVFGNGMLSSRTIRLVAAFDHRHVFIDPDPDPGRSFEAGADCSPWPVRVGRLRPRRHLGRRRRAGPGGRRRSPSSPEARVALGTDAAAMSGPQLVSTILAAPVDLLWFGGIGTFVRHPEETDAEVGDRANDAVRITADQLRARVVVEGANLGATQRARLRYSRRGGRINTDFIDNAAGVATSDREVNLKILLALAVEQGRVDAAQRDEVLAAVADPVAHEVLAQVARSVAALSRAVPASATELDAYESLLAHLHSEGRVDRAVEALPDRAEISVRREAGAGLIRPELAVLLAYAKSDIVERLEESELVHRATIAGVVRAYFPEAVVARFGDLIPRHRLYPQLAATGLAGDLVDRMGVVWTHEIAAQLALPVVDVAAAFWTAEQVLGAAAEWTAIDEQAASLTAETADRLHARVTAAVSELARSYLLAPGSPDPGDRIERDRPLADEVRRALPADAPLRDRVASLATLAKVGDAGRVVRAVGRPVSEVLAVFEALDLASGLDQMARGIRDRPPGDRLGDWQGRALLDDARVAALGGDRAPRPPRGHRVRGHRVRGHRGRGGPGGGRCTGGGAPVGPLPRARARARRRPAGGG